MIKGTFEKFINNKYKFNNKIIPEAVNKIANNIYLEEYGNFSYFLPGTLNKCSTWEVKLKPSKDNGMLYTGSSCTVIGKKFHFKLNERHVDIEKMPISYGDYINKYGNINDYLYTGGFQEYIETKDKNVLYNILYNSVQRICIKYNIKNFRELFDLSLHIVKNPGMTINDIKKMFNINNIDKYIYYLERANIIFKINDINGNAILYTIDNGFANLGNDTNKNGLMENMIARKIITDYKNYNILKDNDSFIIKKGRDEIKRIKIDNNTLNNIFIFS